MAYIGKQPTVGNFVKLDAITTSATATYNLLNGGVAYSPQSANHCIVSLNGVIQEPTSASNVGGFTISGSTIVFTSALTATDVIDFILVLGDVLNIGTPSDGTVTFPKVTSNLITGATAETSIDGSDSVLIYDDSATALRKMTRTNFVAGIGATAGQVIQVVQTIKTDTFSSSSTSLVDITGLSVSITPTSASNKVFVMYSVEIGQYSSNANCTLQLLRAGTAIYRGDQVGSNRKRGSSQTGPSGTENSVQSLTGMFLDSPSTTSSTTYKIQGMSNNSATYQVNQDYGAGSNDDTNRTVSVSQITVMEIKG